MNPLLLSALPLALRALPGAGTSAGPTDATLLAAGPAGASPAAVAQVAESFESMFVSLLLKEMRQTIEPESLFPGDSGDVMGGMFDMFLGNHLAKSNALGIAEMVQRQLTAQLGAAAKPAEAPAPNEGLQEVQTAEGTAQGRSR